MRLECTKKLLDYLGVKSEKAAEPVESVFQWSADLIVLNRRKTLVVTHAASRSMFVICGLTAKVRAKLPELILEGIRTLLRSEYVRPEIIERYLDDCGHDLEIRPNSSRKAITACIQACTRVRQLSQLFEPGDLFQKELLPERNEDMVPEEKYRFVHELLIECLQAQDCRAGASELLAASQGPAGSFWMERLPSPCVSGSGKTCAHPSPHYLGG